MCSHSPISLLTLTLFAALITLCFTTSRSSIDRRRRKRDLLQFCKMVQCGTRRSCLQYLGHGCWCGAGHKANATVDNVDECCRMHDKCYSRAEYYCLPYVTYYEWRCRRESGKNATVECLPNRTGCAALVCQCDAQFVTCINKHQHHKRAACSFITDMES